MIDHSYTLSSDKQDYGLTAEILDELYKSAKKKWNDLKVDTRGSNLFQSSSLSDERSLGLEDYLSTVQTVICEEIKKMKTNADYEVSVAMLKKTIENFMINEIRTRNPWSYWAKNNAEIYRSINEHNKKISRRKEMD